MREEGQPAPPPVNDDWQKETTDQTPPPPRDPEAESSRPTPVERALADPVAAAFIAPRVALGSATQALNLLQKGELFGLAQSVIAQVPAEVSMFVQAGKGVLSM